MNTEQLREYKGETVVVDNNILTDFMEINAALDYDYISLLNKLFSEVKIPTPVLEDENIYDSLGSLEYIEGTINSELGFNIFIELGNSEDNMVRRLSEYDRYVIAIAGKEIFWQLAMISQLERFAKSTRLRLQELLV